mmetsp:Transcript_11794/g.23739  ORF Transcript_11794/g.23739 Transcript_11794/m.23739 type:complete len:270 (-) Transcript_11794:3613-4422(-)
MRLLRFDLHCYGVLRFSEADEDVVPAKTVVLLDLGQGVSVVLHPRVPNFNELISFGNLLRCLRVGYHVCYDTIHEVEPEFSVREGVEIDQPQILLIPVLSPRLSEPIRNNHQTRRKQQRLEQEKGCHAHTDVAAQGSTSAENPTKGFVSRHKRKNRDNKPSSEDENDCKDDTHDVPHHVVLVNGLVGPFLHTAADGLGLILVSGSVKIGVIVRTISPVVVAMPLFLFSCNCDRSPCNSRRCDLLMAHVRSSLKVILFPWVYRSRQVISR